MADIPKGFKLVDPSKSDIPAGFKLVGAPAAPAVVPEPTGPSVLESGVRGVARGGSLGFAPQVAGAVKALDLFEPGSSIRGLPGDIARRFTEGKEEFAAGQELAQETNPRAFGAGEVLGTLGPLALAGGPAVGAKLGANVLRGVKAGGIVGGAREAGAGGSAVDIATGALGGATIGAALPLAGAGAGLVGAGAKRAGPLLEKLAVGGATTAGAVASPALAVPAALVAKGGIKAIKALAGRAPQEAATQAAGRGVLGPLVTAGALTEGAQATGGVVQRLVASGAKSLTAKQATPAEKFVASETSEKFRTQSLEQANKDFEKDQRRQGRAR